MDIDAAVDLGADEEEFPNELDDDTLHEYILQYDDKEITVNVNKKTAYLLTNDHSYAEQYMTSLEEGDNACISPDIEYLHDMDTTSTSDPIVVGRKASSNGTSVVKSESNDYEGFWSWTNHSREMLVTIRIKMEEKFQNPKYLTTPLWDQLAAVLNKETTMQFTGDVCLHKWNNLMAKYRRVQSQTMKTGREPSWSLYNLFYAEYGELTTAPKTPLYSLPRCDRKERSVRGKAMSATLAKALLKSRLRLEHLFAQPDCNADELWEMVASEIKLDRNVSDDPAQTCRDKWISLINRYKEKLEPEQSEDVRLLWPYFQIFHDAFGDNIPPQYLSDENQGLWSLSRVKQLLKLRVALEDSFQMPGARKAKLWAQIADQLNEVFPEICVSGTDCDEKFRSSLKSYRSNVLRLQNKRYVNWPHFQILHEAYGAQEEKFTSKPVRASPNKKVNTNTKLWTGKSVELLIKFRLEMEDSFVNHTCKISSLWCQLSRKLNDATQTNDFFWKTCMGKWRKLRLNYDTIVDKSLKTGVVDTVWPYFDMFHEVYGNQAIEMATDTISQYDSDDSANELLSDLPNQSKAKSQEKSNRSVPTLEARLQLGSKRLPPQNVSPVKTSVPTRTMKLDARLRQTNNVQALTQPTKKARTQFETQGERVSQHNHEHFALDPEIFTEAGSPRKFVTLQEYNASVSSAYDRFDTNKKNGRNKASVSSEAWLPTNVDNETVWLKDMLLEWKKERHLKWEEKKKLEKEKILALNNLTKAILSLSKNTPSGSENCLEPINTNIVIEAKRHTASSNEEM